MVQSWRTSVDKDFKSWASQPEILLREPQPLKKTFGNMNSSRRTEKQYTRPPSCKVPFRQGADIGKARRISATQSLAPARQDSKTRDATYFQRGQILQCSPCVSKPAHLSLTSNHRTFLGTRQVSETMP